jgi:two-component system phosphate regulon sensor histidine kinase PhoR
MYYKGGYRKIVILPTTSNSLSVFFFTKAGGYGSFIILDLDPERFIKEVLAPRIQQVARDKFYISALQDDKDSIIYISDRAQRTVEPEYTKKFWLIPHYSLGITLKDSKISDLVRERSRKNLMLILVIDLILLFGIWLIYRNVKKQVELTQLKSDFVSNVSHEIRTPLALITMYIETLEMGRINSSQKIKEYYQVILQETQRLTTIVNKILSFSHIESGQRSYTKEITELNEIVQNVLDSYSIRMEKDGFKCSKKLQKDLPSIMIDREALADAVINLIDNAMKYSDQDRFIEIETFKKGTNVILAVSDQGIGISQDEQKYIFDKFYRVTEKDLALRSKGSGLGLPIVKHIMNAHGGKITIESTKGKGSRFELYFPIKSKYADPSKIQT